ncbi:AbiV family abortive infection protein [Achromobacter insolitus]|uniref:AbiV family abortive infection protein n=1 Tax=Achromobacter insolitus TaxID=217204 RepID=UPI00244EB778|nr:AbiV family abortive infection protein [Achromobacter insolitus]MDH3062306.1 AbiV family abortive infection protein [Achromobacter insolitus]
MSLTDEAAALAQDLIVGAEKIFANAEALFSEATILANRQAWPRALLLHQIALEECAKVNELGAAVTSLLMGHEVNVDALRRGFRRHEYKNKANAYFLPPTHVEQLARDSGDFESANQEFKKLQVEFHEQSNKYKNASLYVDFRETFTSPQELINEEAFVEVRKRNEEFMSIAFHLIRMLRDWAGDLKRSAEQVTEAMTALGIIELDRSNEEQFKSFVDSLDDKIQELVQKRRADAQ